MKETIVLYPAPGSRHAISMVELAKLISQHQPNLSITIFITNTTPFGSSLENQTSKNPQISFFTLPDLHLRHENRVESAIQSIRLSLPVVFQALQAISQTSKVQAFITSAVHCPFEHDPPIPTYFHFTSCASALALFLYLPTLLTQTTKSFHELNDAVLDIPGLPPIPASQMPQPLLHRGGPAYDYFLNFANCLPKSQGIITNTVHALEPRAIQAIIDGDCVPDRPTPPVYHIGPLISDVRSSTGQTSTSTSNEYLVWLDEQPSQSVVFLCFGSRGAFSEAQLKEIAVGLERSGRRFIWVVRSPPGSDSADPDPETLLPNGFLERTRNRGLVAKSWAPQVEILRHGSVGGFVTHCGWNSVLEAVACGVPMAAWPLYAEQGVNGVVLVEEMRLGVRIESEEGLVSAEEVEKKVTLLMEFESAEGKSRRERSQAVKAMCLAAWATGGSSLACFSKMVASWTH